MEANNFVAKLKANGDNKDDYDLAKRYLEYTEILKNLSTKDKSSLSLNVLCMLCRNLEKVPTWKEKINDKDLLRLGIECVRHTRSLEGPEQVKALACIYHLHKYVTKQNTSIPPELVLKLSFMPFECENVKLLKEYCKTYWSIISDRLSYIEKLKAKRMPVTKLLPKLLDDVGHVIKIYDTVQFATNFLWFLVKKLNYIYSDIASKELNEGFGKIFDFISNTDLKRFKSLSDKDLMDFYVKLNDILCIVTDNTVQIDCKDTVTDTVARICISMVGHRSDMFHCLQTFFLNSFCCIFKEKIDTNLVDNTFNNLVVSCEMTEKLGYGNVINATYPYIGQLLRIFIERCVNKEIFTENSIDNSLKLINILLEKLKKTNQLLKCENCSVKTGYHDALRLSFQIKHLVTIAVNQKIDTNNILPVYCKLVEEQYVIIKKLKEMGCVNQDKCFRKLQTDVHNTAITLNKAQMYEYSIKLFDIYVKNEVVLIKSEEDLKNVSRALYNKSICELDVKLYEDSLKSSYLSLIFSLPESMKSEKHMGLIMDIKSKSLSCVNDDGDAVYNYLQKMTILDVFKLLHDGHLDGDFKWFIKDFKFSELLKREFEMYIKIWPSLAPITAILNNLNDLVNEKHAWVEMEDKEVLRWTMFEIVLATPVSVRAVYDDSLCVFIETLLEEVERYQPTTVEEKIVHCTLLFLKAEIDVEDASQMYGWKITTDNTADANQAEVTRTVEDEHNAVSHALRAIHELTTILPTLKTLKPSSWINNALQIYQMSVQHLMMMQRTLYSLQLAYICCHMADLIGDKEAYVRNVGLLAYHSDARREPIDEMTAKCAKYLKDLLNNERSLDLALGYMCEVAIYYTKVGSVSVAAKLVQTVQAHMLRVHENGSDVNLHLSTARLIEAEAVLSPDSGRMPLLVVNALQRHYFVYPSTSNRWAQRRLMGHAARARSCHAAAAALRLNRALRAPRRAAASAAAVMTRAGAVPAALLTAAAVNVHCPDDAQTKLDNCIKYILGLQSPNDVLTDPAQAPKIEQFTPKQAHVEAVLDSKLKKTQVSPSVPCVTVPAFHFPDFMQHAKTCTCYACDIPECTIIACYVSYLDASLYYRAKEFHIASNYFRGATKVFALAQNKINFIFDRYENKFHNIVVGISKNFIKNYLNEIHLEFLVEQAFFELSRSEFERADEIIISIHEILAEARNIDKYLQNEISNLMVASAQLRKTSKPKHLGIENDFENLKLSPAVPMEHVKTPETKNALPTIAAGVIVEDEEIPKKRKVIKLNFEEPNQEENAEKTESKSKAQFKIPEPVTIKPSLEKITPRPSRSKPETTPRSTWSIPDIVIQQPSIDVPATPVSEEACEFFTPSQSTPAENFFTPMTSVKTYSRKVVKNLEMEFLTPAKGTTEIKTRKLIVESGTIKGIKDKRSLRRATSPGKLVDEKPARSSKILVEKPARAAKLLEEKPARAAKILEEKPARAAKLLEEKPARAAKILEEKPARAAKILEEKPARAAKILEEKSARPAKILEEKSAKPAKILEEKSAKPAKILEEKPARPGKLVQEKSTRPRRTRQPILNDK